MGKRVLVTQRSARNVVVSEFDGSNVEVDFRDSDEPVEPGELIDLLTGYQGVICALTDQMDADVMKANPQLEVVANVAVGYDNIDVEAASRLGIAVTNTPDVLTETTADLTMALMLGVARRIPEADEFVRSGSWQRWELFPRYLGTDLYDKTLGVVGMGRIGQAVARRAVYGFGMNLLYTGRSRLSSESEEECRATYVDFDSLLRSSDVLSLHTPYTPETHHLIGAPQLKLMRASAIVINTARGSLVDEVALANALANGRLWGAGLDVFEREPQVYSELLNLHERMVLAPHIGSATSETRQRMVAIASKNARAVLEGGVPVSPVTD